MESVAENAATRSWARCCGARSAGPAGVAAYRAANTLDAMVGHRNERYGDFGWAAAKLDDAMSWPAARLTAALACAAAPLVGGSPREAATTVRRDGALHPSPNAGASRGGVRGSTGRPPSIGRSRTAAVWSRVQSWATAGRPGVEDVRRAARLSLAVGGAASRGPCAR